MHPDLTGVMLWLRVTARISGVLLACGFAAYGLQRLWPAPFTSWLAANRHRLILLFALSHSFHLAGIIKLATLAPAQFSAQFVTKPGLVGLIGGGLGYVFIYYVAWPALRQKSAGSREAELHPPKLESVGLYFLWTIFTLAFTTGIWKNALIYAPLAIVMWSALIVRVWANLAVVSARSSAAA